MEFNALIQSNPASETDSRTSLAPKKRAKAKAWLLALGWSALTLTACHKDEDKKQDRPEPPTVSVMNEVEGTWTAGSRIEVAGHISVPEGKSLTIEEGVQVIFDEKGVGSNHAPIEFTVKGNLYIKGTAANPVRLTVKETLRTADNIFQEDALWGGIVAMESCGEMLIDHAIIEYTGGQVVEGSPAATNGIYTAGDDAYPQITTNNINGRYVIRNSVIRNGWSDGIYLMGGSAIISGNIFAANGYDGAEAVNVKAGCTVDVSGNIMFSPNTNGLKLSSSGQSENRGQARIQAYNNTVINAGWRRDGEKGGCVYVEKNALVNAVNNLFVNCKFRAMTPSYDNPDNPEGGYDNRSVIDYNYYASGRQRSDIVFEEESGVAYAWQGYNYAHKNYSPDVDRHSVIATETDGKDPLFENFDINNVPLTRYVYDESWNFHLTAASPALTAEAHALNPYFAGEGLSIGGEIYTSPAVANRYGAFGRP